MSIPHPHKKNDADCHNCAGMIVWSHEMLKAGQNPKCYGIEYKAGKSIPSEVMTQLEELPVIPPYSRVYIIGLSQSSARMRRLGQVPIAKFGVKIVLSQQDGGRESRTQEKVENVKTHFSTDEQPQSVRIKQNVVDPNNHANATVTALDRFLARYNTNVVENLASTYKRSCYRLMLSMSKVYDRVTDKFPEKMYRSSIVLVDACNKFANKVCDRLKKILTKIED